MNQLIFKNIFFCFSKIYPKFDDIQINTIHFDIESKQERLFYYPIYIINYFYKKHDQFICLVDGVTGCIVGDRQYSMVKVTTATFVTFYPLLKIALFSFGSVANFLLGFEIAAEITFLSILPLAFVISPCIGLFASSYSKKYRKSLIKDQWERDQANASKSTHTYHMIDQDSMFVPIDFFNSLVIKISFSFILVLKRSMKNRDNH